MAGVQDERGAPDDEEEVPAPKEGTVRARVVLALMLLVVGVAALVSPVRSRSSSNSNADGAEAVEAATGASTRKHSLHDASLSGLSQPAAQVRVLARKRREPMAHSSRQQEEVALSTDAAHRKQWNSKRRTTFPGTA